MFRCRWRGITLPADCPKAPSHSQPTPPDKAKSLENEILSATATVAGRYHRWLQNSTQTRSWQANSQSNDMKRVSAWLLWLKEPYCLLLSINPKSFSRASSHVQIQISSSSCHPQRISSNSQQRLIKGKSPITQLFSDREMTTYELANNEDENSFLQLTDATIRGAVALWFTNKQQALAVYGPIKDWDVVGVTNMSLWAEKPSTTTSVDGMYHRWQTCRVCSFLPRHSTSHWIVGMYQV